MSRQQSGADASPQVGGGGGGAFSKMPADNLGQVTPLGVASSGSEASPGERAAAAVERPPAQQARGGQWQGRRRRRRRQHRVSARARISAPTPPLSSLARKDGPAGRTRAVASHIARWRRRARPRSFAERPTERN